MLGQSRRRRDQLVGPIPQVKYLGIHSVPVVRVPRRDCGFLDKCSKGLFFLARRFDTEGQRIVVILRVARRHVKLGLGIARSCIAYIQRITIR